MSFVSVLANNNFITVVADGRVVNVEGESTDENFKKFKKISQNQFIAFAGSKEPCESVVNQVEYSNEKVYDLKQLANEIHGAIYDVERFNNLKLLFIVGGLNPNNEIEFHSVDHTIEVVQSYYPRVIQDFKYAYMHSSKIDIDVDAKLAELNRQIGTNSINKCLKIQQELNKYVSQYDSSVNRITNKLRIRK